MEQTTAKKNKYEIDMCNGTIMDKLISFSLPLMLSGILQLMFNAVDIIVVGRFSGSQALAAVGSTSALINVFTNLFIGISLGANVLAARFFASGREKEMSKVVLITGASRGIGHAEAEKFAREGYQVIANYHNSKERMEQFAQQMAEQGLSVIPMQADVSDEVQVKRMVEEILSQFGHIDVLICNAGIARQGLFTDFTADQWHNMMAVNLDSVFYCCKEVLPSMIRRQKGSIITTSSIWGISGASCEVPYSASKAAVIGLTKALAKEVGPSGIRVNCIAPGVIDTEMNGNLTAEVMEELKEETPLCQIGTPQQVADCAFFLAEEGASFLTGQVISPNGGFLI